MFHYKPFRASLLRGCRLQPPTHPCDGLSALFLWHIQAIPCRANPMYSIGWSRLRN